MEVILNDIAMLAIAAASVCALFGLLFVEAPRRWPMRSVTIALGALAIVLPLMSLYDTVGFPDPWPEPGEYEVFGWKFDEPRRAIYAFAKKDGEDAPSLYKLGFDFQMALQLQEAREHPEYVARIGMTVSPGAEGAPAVAFEIERKTVIRSLAEVEAEQEELLRAQEARRAFQSARDGARAEGSAAAAGSTPQEMTEDERESLERMKREIAAGTGANTTREEPAGTDEDGEDKK